MDGGLYIKGFSDSGMQFRKGFPLMVRYGIESYYVQQ
jgi:hypothetical protein